MLERLVDGLVQGDRPPWAIVATLWLFTAALVLLRRRGARRGALRVLVLLGATATTSAVALALASALAIPRLRWTEVETPELVAPTGDAWRKLRGPPVSVTVAGAPDVALPALDASDRWVLFALLSGRVIEGVAPAIAAPIEAGAARICRTDREECRPWPVSWPAPGRPLSLDELLWSRPTPASITAHPPLAYDVEAGLYLRRVEPRSSGPSDPANVVGDDGLPARPVLEMTGRFTSDPPRSGTTSLFVLRGIADRRLRAVRVVSVPVANGFTFHLQRADVSLATGPTVLKWVARPVLWATLCALPLGALVLLLSPVLFALRLKRRGAVQRVLERALTIVPIAGRTGPGPVLGTVSEDANLGDALLPAGAVVSFGPGVYGGAPVRSQIWYELPAGVGDEGAAVRLDERGASRKVGALVPGDAGAFRRAAVAWASGYVGAAGALAAGVAAAAPAVVAIASLWGSR